MTAGRGWAVVAVAALAVMPACASRPAPPAMPSTPAIRDLPPLMVPASLQAPAGIIARHDAAWRLLQEGDAPRAVREFVEILRLAPGFYPSTTALGYIAAFDRRYDEAVRRFDAAIALDQTYLPALTGRLDVALVRREDPVVLRTSALILAVSPGRDDLRDRMEVLRLRMVQSQLSRASAERSAGRLDEAQAVLEEALAAVPDSAVVLRELALVETARGRLEAAETHAQRSLALDRGDAVTHAVLATVFEAQGRMREAADQLAWAIRIDPRAEWVDRARALTVRADYDALPAEYREIPTAPTVTRGQLAALLGIRLPEAVARSPRRGAVVLTDVRAHWAMPWILPVTRAGWIDAFPNHTFQPATLVRRSELAQVMWRAAQDLAVGQPAELARWRASRPVLPDVSRSHLAYAAIAGALASGTMHVGPDGRFMPNQRVTGAEATAAVARLEHLAQQWGRP